MGIEPMSALRKSVVLTPRRTERISSAGSSGFIFKLSFIFFSFNFITHQTPPITYFTFGGIYRIRTDDLLSDSQAS